ncbi:hypothetical protein OG264_19500 [Streptomyces xanthophaeus]|uniref:hypothetical protein n=1 Tax=Streptomyces xanthophaeus TaxID=67385 RepID=UPI00386D5162|nr:hypothetical protein OG264_19500 [Streptomyces xanthophaeus]WST61524.1 hypothetical protein OG605_18940 [Streptomyces xanthophaeus]
MAIRTRGTHPERAVAVLAAAVALAGCAGLLTWWNTDALGPDRFCAGALASSEAGSALSGPGRIVQQSLQDGSDPYYSFSCKVQRTNKFLSDDQPSLEAELSFDGADFAWAGSALWKDASAFSYFVGGATGATSETQAWVLLPVGCPGAARPNSKESQVPVLKVNLAQGRTTPEALARVAMSGARHVADGLGCKDTGALKDPARLQGPAGAPKPTDPANACGIPGFRLPEAALVQGKAEQGTERVTGKESRTRVCSLDLKGSGAPRIDFAVSDDPVLTQGVRHDKAATRERGRTVTTCKDGDLYLGMSLNDAYSDLLLDEGMDKASQARTALFEAFANAVTAERGCGTPKS